jgi:hypothetical protein
MKYSHHLGAAVLALSFAGGAFAADETTMKPENAGMASSPFGKLDTNKDGRLSQAEIQSNADLTSRFATLDIDHDTYLSQSEYGKWNDPANSGKGNPGRSQDNPSADKDKSSTTPAK